MFNLAMDVDHTTLGFTTAWVNALARRCAHVSVITMFAGELAVEDNVAVHSLGKERGWSESHRLWVFYRHVAKVLRERQIDACFAHMAPLFATLFAPIAKPTRVPVLLWYAHGSMPKTVRLAHALSDRCVTSTPSAFRLPSAKLFVIGQGIDTEVFRPPAEVPPDYMRTTISIGRISRTKRIDEMLAALAILRADRGIDARLEVTGEPLTSLDWEYQRELLRDAESLGVMDAVAFVGAVPYREIPARYHRGAIFLNLSENRSIDKAILESMASGCIPVSRNESFQALAAKEGLQELVPGPGADGVADCLARMFGRSLSDREALVARLRRIVTREHCLGSLADTLLIHLGELAGRNIPPRGRP